MKFFKIGEEIYIAISNTGGASDVNIYKWSTARFEKYDNITKNCGFPIRLEPFKIAEDHFLVVAHAAQEGRGQHSERCDTSYGDPTANVVIVHKWQDGRFVEFRTIAATDPYGLKSFEIEGKMHLAVAGSYTVKIYKWDGLNFGTVQTIPCMSSFGMDFVDMGAEQRLTLPCMYGDDGVGGTSYETNSFIFKWTGVAFVEEHALATSSAMAMKSFGVGGQWYLAVANGGYDNSKIYKWGEPKE